MSRVTVTINGQSYEIESGTTVLDAAWRTGVSIPTLCHHHLLPRIGFCRLCLVEIEGQDLLQPACSFPLTQPVSVWTHSPRVLESRRMTLELLVARSQHSLGAYRARETFDRLLYEFGISPSRFASLVPPSPLDLSSPAMAYNPNACIQCGLCVSTCGDLQQVYAINFEGYGVQQSVQPALRQPLAEVECTSCGQCTTVCPTGAFVEQDHLPDVLAALADQAKFVIAVVFPSVGTAIGMEYGQDAGTDLTGQLVNGLKHVGIDLVFNAGFGHDIVAIETAFELRARLQTGERLPLIISSCPALVKHVEHLYPGLIPYLSVNRSPAQMFGTILKTYYAEKLGRLASDIVVIQVTPCVASKFERTRPELGGVDIAITTREAARLLEVASGCDLPALSPLPFDAPFGDASGAGILSEMSGGTTEAILRTFRELRLGREQGTVEFDILRGFEPIRQTEITVGTERLRVAVAYDLGHGSEVLRRVQDGHEQYHLIEIMACPGGCVGGGGHPISPIASAPWTAARVADPLYQVDRDSAGRKPRENVALNHLYAEFLKTPFGEKPEQLLQTTYMERGRY
ncbi:MAG: (2Fe-2S)-binding protein [Candidatus Latescibacteria bacterium]|nr:(2Fe-2S)-binding protein [Candidatus Latescibacterota bacterium]